ncbi:hypothetical protein TNCV_3685711 [Trichonephila clavipes]|nr:hypothetical protein TNCV_3685711 [Trichonephila clavipes]
MIACFVEENHENWERFLHEFAFALRTSVNETTIKTPAELFLGRKILTPFSKLINVTEGAEYVGRNIEKLCDEARQNMRKPEKFGENIIIGNEGRISTRCECTVHDNPTRLVRKVMLRHCMKDRGRVIGQVDRNQENSKDLGKPRVSRVTVVNQVRLMPDGRIRD